MAFYELKPKIPVLKCSNHKANQLDKYIYIYKSIIVFTKANAVVTHGSKQLRPKNLETSNGYYTPFMASDCKHTYFY